jgi:hypothetical protein
MLEMTYDPNLAGKQCPRCGPEGPVMVPTVGRRDQGGETGPSTTGTALAAVTIALVVVQGGLYGWVVYDRWRRQAQNKRANLLVCRCPFCKRKFGYPPHKIGAPMVCSRCKTTFALPATGVTERI